MTNSTLNETFISKRDFEEESVNEKLLFNTALLEECKEYTEKIEIDLKKFGGKLYHDELGLIDIETVHPVGEPLFNQRTQKCDFPNGLQIRADMITDAEKVQQFEIVIDQRRWKSRAQQIVLVRLPEEYQYCCGKTGKKVVWGVLDGNHRVKAATNKLQRHLIAWTVEMSLKKFGKYAIAVLNNDIDNVRKDRSDNDILKWFLGDLDDPESSLHKNTIAARQSKGDPDKEVLKVWALELDDYRMHANKRNAILRRLQQDQTEYYKGTRPWSKEAMELHITDDLNTFTKGWKRLASTQIPEDYVTPTGVKVIRFFDTGNDLYSAMIRFCDIKWENPDAKVMILFAIQNGKDISTPELLSKERNKVMEKWYNTMEKVWFTKDGMDRGEISDSSWRGYPQNDKELERGGFTGIHQKFR